MCVWMLLVSSRLVNTAGPTSDAEDDINKEGVHKQPTSRLKALLQFYQESEVNIFCLFEFRAVVFT